MMPVEVAGEQRISSLFFCTFQIPVLQWCAQQLTDLFQSQQGINRAIFLLSE